MKTLRLIKTQAVASSMAPGAVEIGIHEMGCANGDPQHSPVPEGTIAITLAACLNALVFGENPFENPR